MGFFTSKSQKCQPFASFTGRKTRALVSHAQGMGAWMCTVSLLSFVERLEEATVTSQKAHSAGLGIGNEEGLAQSSKGGLWRPSEKVSLPGDIEARLPVQTFSVMIEIKRDPLGSKGELSWSLKARTLIILIRAWGGWSLTWFQVFSPWNA